MKILKTVLTALLVLTLIFTADVYGLSYEASNHYELKNIILEQMKEYNTEFNIRYTGSLDNIKEVLEETVNSDIYLNSNVSRVDWNISGTKTLSNIKVKVSYILTKEEFDALMQDTEGSYEGIGVYITAGDDNRIVIVSPIEDTPAEKAGLKTGDKIIRINGVEYTADQINAAVNVMKGEPGTSVTLTIQRVLPDGSQSMSDLQIKREKIRINTVKSSMLEDDIGYIRVTTFDMQTASDFKTAYKTLKNKGVKGLVIDLRYNPGGMINSTVEISDIFLGEGIVTYTKTKSGEIEYFKSNAKYEDIPIVILINEGSASASEIMAGAMKDTKRAVLVGNRTFGKGIVQKVQRFGNEGEGIKMTVSEYFTPAGINIHGVGIEPDVEIELPDDAEGYGYEYYETDTQLQKAVEILRK
jgi:carboxyl-terminal processing protease